MARGGGQITFHEGLARLPPRSTQTALAGDVHRARRRLPRVVHVHVCHVSSSTGSATSATCLPRAPRVPCTVRDSTRRVPWRAAERRVMNESMT